jgi:cytochrome c553
MTGKAMRKATPSILAALVAFLGAISTAHAQDAAAGEKKAAMCIGCHGIVGYQASFPEIHKVPMIAGQGAKYIVSSLVAYKKGERKHPTMRGIAGSLSDADMADLAAYYEKQNAPMLKSVADAPAVAPSAEVAALLTKGACSSCHGANYSRPIDPGYPKIAGQHGDYLAVALHAYTVQGNPQVGRSNAIMAGQVKQFKAAELKAMAKYIGSLPGELSVVPQARFR